MKLTIGDFGKLMFETMIGHSEYYRGTSDHWESIRDRAEPLVRELVKLNAEMVNSSGKKGGYQLVNYIDEEGKPVRTDGARMREAQVKLWGVEIEDLKVGDRIFHEGGNCEYLWKDYDDPVEVLFIKDDTVYVEKGYDRGDCTSLSPGQSWITVLKVPEDWEERYEEYCSAEYWMERAKQLGI